MANSNGNETETLARELRKPDIREVQGRPLFIVPDGYRAELHEELLERPVRKKGTVTLSDSESFIAYVKREGSLASCNIYCEVDYLKGLIEFTAILNDHEEEDAHWRDYRAIFAPQKSYEWKTWLENNRRNLSQADFAHFLEENNKDIASVDGMPTGAQVLAMAINFEARQEVHIKSALRTQSGTVEFSYTNNEDSATIERMEMYKGFSLGLTPFFNGKGYRLDVRLKYRHANGKVSFWYELDRPDLVLQTATQEIIDSIKNQAGFPIFFGCP